MELKAKSRRAPAFQHIASGTKKSRIFHDEKNVLQAIGLREYERTTLHPLLKNGSGKRLNRRKRNRTTKAHG